MKIEKRSTDQGKTYRSNHQILDSYDNALAELSSLYERLQNRIDELSNYMRKGDKQEEKDLIEAMNNLKYHRTKVRLAKQQVEGIKNETWRDLKPTVQSTFDKAEEVLNQVPNYTQQEK